MKNPRESEWRAMMTVGAVVLVAMSAATPCEVVETDSFAVA